jgi:hypothetical protein
MGSSPFLTSIYERMRVMRYAKRTIDTYIHWIRDFMECQAAHPLNPVNSRLTNKY